MKCKRIKSIFDCFIQEVKDITPNYQILYDSKKCKNISVYHAHVGQKTFNCHIKKHNNFKLSNEFLSPSIYELLVLEKEDSTLDSQDKMLIV